MVLTVIPPAFNLYRIAASGSGDPVRLTESPNVQTATDWSRDGRFIVYHESVPGTQTDLWVLTVTPQGVVAESAKPRLYLRTPSKESWARFSPEPSPRWLAYQSDESGRAEVYIQTFPEARGKLRISQRGGSFPTWGPDGHTLYYLSLDNKLVVVSLKLGADSVEPSAPRELFALPPSQSGQGSPPYDIAPGWQALRGARHGAEPVGLDTGDQLARADQEDVRSTVIRVRVSVGRRRRDEQQRDLVAHCAQRQSGLCRASTQATFPGSSAVIDSRQCGQVQVCDRRGSSGVQGVTKTVAFKPHLGQRSGTDIAPTMRAF